MRRLLVLRPQPGASETLDRARQCGLDAFAVPLFEIEPVDWQPPEPSAFDALLLTSANAVRCAGERLSRLRALPVHAVGAATAEAARNAGFEIATSGEWGVDRLLEAIDPAIRLLHLCGEQRIASSDADQRTTAVPVYRTKAIAEPDLSGAEGSVALIHSPRAGLRFGELVERRSLDRSSIMIAAISRAAVDATGTGWSQAQAANHPEDDALLALAATLCHKSARG